MDLDKVGFTGFDMEFTKAIFVIKGKNSELKDFIIFLRENKDFGLENVILQIIDNYFKTSDNREVRD